MKNIVSTIVLVFVILLSTHAQQVSNYTYKLDNGISIKTDHCWNQVWIQQSFTPMSKDDKGSPLAVNIRALGDLIAGSEYKLTNGGKEVKMQGVVPGKYELNLAFKLSGKPGKLSFSVGNIEIKAGTRTAVSVTLYDYQINISEKQSPSGGLSEYTSSAVRCKAHTSQDVYPGVITFYEKGKHDKAITPDQATGKSKGKIKAGTYDVLMAISISNQTHQVWLDNFQLKPDVSYEVTVNLNAGGIIYTGINKDIKGLSLYQAGTAAKQAGKPERVKNLETISFDNVNIVNPCSPGVYDVLLRNAKETKLEWKKNIAISSGARTEIK